MKIAQLKNHESCPVLAADWLPVIFQNPTQPELTWPSFHKIPSPQPWWKKVLSNPSVYLIGALPLIVSAILIPKLIINDQRPIQSSRFKPPLSISLAKDDGFSIGEELLIDDELLVAQDSAADKFHRPKTSDQITVADTAETLAQKGTVSFHEALEIKDREPDSLDAIKAKYTEAQQYFTASLSEFRNDPEVQIYLNNVEVALAHLKSVRPIVTLGVSVPLKTTSGDFLIGDDVGGSQEVLRGIAQAQRQLNCGIERAAAVDDETFIRNCSVGLRGDSPLLQVRIGNHGNNERDNIDKIEEVAKELISHQDLMGIVAWYTSDATKALSSLFESEKTVLISPTSTAHFESGVLSQYVFRTSPTDQYHVERIADYLSDQNVSTIGIVWEEADSFSKLYKETFTDYLSSNNGVNLSSNTQQACGTLSDMENLFQQEPCLRKPDETLVESLLIVPSMEDIDRAEDVAREYRRLSEEANSTPILVGADTLYSFESTQTQEFDGMIFAVPWFRNQGDNMNTFERYAVGLWGDAVNWRSAMAYDSTAIFYEALEKASCQWGIEEPANCRIQIQAKLAGKVALDYGATGKLRFLDGNRSVSSDEENRSNGDGILLELTDKKFKRILD